MSDALLKVEGVSKKFCRNLKKSLWYGIQDLGSELKGRRPDTFDLRSEEFWAVKDVSFELKRGDCLGLVGSNGAGKSTLLKMLNGLIKPDKGRIEICGQVGALIELGAGFNPVLTGRENIYINGSVLGFTKKEIDEKFDSIVDFSEIGNFLETPVQNYSSGMKVRLGFAVAAQMSPDVLLIDEVLAVGDAGFRAKCFNAVSKLMDKTAVIFVSHSMPDVCRVATKMCVLDKGDQIFYGNDISTGVDAYFSQFSTVDSVVSDNDIITINRSKIKSGSNIDPDRINYMDNVKIIFDIKVKRLIKNAVIYLNISTQSLQTVVQCNSLYNNIYLSLKEGVSSVEIDLGKINLNPGNYYLSLGVMEGARGKVIMRHLNFRKITIVGDYLGFAPVQICAEWGVNGEKLLPVRNLGLKGDKAT